MADKVEFHQVYYEEWQRDHLFLWAKPYFNETLTPFFENSIICDLVTKSESDKIAICSWALKQKMSMRVPPRSELTEEVLQTDFDIMSFSKNAPDHEMMGQLDVAHPGAVRILEILFAKMGLILPKKPKFPIYQNAFCARLDIYKEYVMKFLHPAMNLMTMDDQIRNLCNQDSKYTRTILNVPVNMERVNRYLGLPWVPLHPFLLERCFSAWIDNKGYKVVYL